MRLSFVIFISGVLFFSSCRKDKDEIRPDVEFISPLVSGSYSVFDTIEVFVSASDDRNLEYIEFQITKTNGTAILPAQVESSIEGTSISVGKAIVISDVHIETGTYYIQVTVSDGENEKNIFEDITIFEAPLEVARTLLHRNPGPNEYLLDSLDQLGNWQNCISLNSGYESSAVNNWDQEILIAHDENADLTFLQPITGTVRQSLSFPSNSPSPYWQDLIFDRPTLSYFTTGYDGYMRSFRNTGSSSLSLTIDPQYRPETVAVSEDLIFIEEVLLNMSGRRLSIYSRNSGSLLQSFALDIDLEKIIPIDDDVIALFGNNSGDSGEIQFYFISANAISNFLTEEIPGEEIIEVVQTSGQTGIMHSGGNLRNFSINETSGANLSIPIVLNGVIDIEYNFVNNTILTLNNSELSYLNSDGSTILSIPVSSDARAIDLLYNK